MAFVVSFCMIFNFIKIIDNEINNYGKLISWKRRHYENVWFGNFPGSSPADGPADRAQW